MKNRGFVVSAILYPLLVLFLAIIMGLISFSDTRKKVLDKMKLEISDSIFDDTDCDCDTLLNKINYLIKNGSSGGTIKEVRLNIEVYQTPSEIPYFGESNDIAIITTYPYDGSYYISNKQPQNPQNGTIWIHPVTKNGLRIVASISEIPLGLCYQYYENSWHLVPAYIYMDHNWEIFSDNYNNYRILIAMVGEKSSQYSTLEAMLNDKTLMQKIIYADNPFAYLLKSETLLANIRHSSSYDDTVRSYFLNTTVLGLTNKQKYDLGLPCYLFQAGTRVWDGTDTNLINWTVTISNGSNSSTINRYFIYLSSSDNGSTAGVRQVRSTNPIDLSRYSKVYFDHHANGNSGTSNAYIQFGSKIAYSGSQTVSRRTTTLNAGNDYLYFYVYVQENSHYQNLTIYNIYAD